MTDLKNRILNFVKDDLENIEKALTDNLNPFVDIITSVANHIMFSGGKRIRPLLTVLCAKICGYHGEIDKTISTIFEYMHTASLMHDDLVDEATLRRGKPVTQAVWNNATAVLIGDFLLARTLSIALAYEKRELIEIIAQITESMTQGEILQLINKGNLNLTEKDYMATIEKKTAILIQGACKTGAMIADATEHQEKALTEYGYHLGLAFQMADDLLDYTSETSDLGKKIGADLREGKLTLPVIYSLQKARGSKKNNDVKTMEDIIRKRDEFSDDEFGVFKNMLKTYGGIDYTRTLAEDQVKKAKCALDIFDASEDKSILMDLADYTLLRKT
ncbi:MAG: polyprenyl synthetase family protein [Proteobacteria bacterium]|nr:polyprenyl synthetase family protein [Pseudomonadota bacterium]